MTQWRESSRVVVIVNPTSGGGSLGQTWKEKERELRPVLEARGFSDIQVVFTSESDRGSSAVRDAVKTGLRHLAVAGGDGTLSEVVQGLFEGPDLRPIAEDVNLITLPTGRGNDFFKSLVGKDFHAGLEPWKRGLKNLEEGRPSPIDVGRVDLIDRNGSESSRIFINVVSFAYPGLVVQRVLGREGWVGRSPLGASPLTYLAQSAAALMKYSPMEMTVKVDGEVLYEGPVFSGFVLNGAFNGGGMRWSRDARLDDGIFHLYLAEPQSPVASVVNLPRMYTGDWKDVDGVRLSAGKVIEIRLTDPGVKRHRIFDIDGDQPELDSTVAGRFTALPMALRAWRTS